MQPKPPTLAQISTSLRLGKQKGEGGLRNRLRAPNFNPIDFVCQIDGKTPLSSAGNFAVSYKVKERKNNASRSNWVAVRVWFTKVDDDTLHRYERLVEILDRLKSSKSRPRGINFARVKMAEPPNRGILIKEKRFPFVVMEWVEGRNLDTYILDLMRDKSKKKKDRVATLDLISKRVISLSKYLVEQGVEHGDLSPGNIIVSNRGGVVTLNIIDFDSIYREDLKKCRPSTPGHPDWQHPLHVSGSSSLYGKGSDAIAIVLYGLSMEAIKEKPGLYDEVGGSAGADGSGLILKKADLQNPESSSIIKRLEKIGGKTRKWIEVLKKGLGDIKYIESGDIWQDIHSIGSNDVDEGEVSLVNYNRGKRHSKRPLSSKKLEISTIDDIRNSMSKGVDQRLLCASAEKFEFRSKMSEEKKLEVWGAIYQFYGGEGVCHPDIAGNYLWALKKVRSSQANKLSDRLIELYPTHHSIVSFMFNRFTRAKDWGGLHSCTKAAIDQNPQNWNIAIHHALAENMATKGEDFRDKIGSALVRNSSWVTKFRSIEYLHKYGKGDDLQYATELLIELMEEMGARNSSKKEPPIRKSRRSQHVINGIVGGVSAACKLSARHKTSQGPSPLVDLLSRQDFPLLFEYLEFRPSTKYTITTIRTLIRSISSSPGIGGEYDSIAPALRELVCWGSGEPIGKLEEEMAKGMGEWPNRLS